MKKQTCERCGKIVDMTTWQTHCYQCQQEIWQEKLKENILSGEEIETSCEDAVYCPYCGDKQDLGDSWDIYEEGEHEYECECCDAKFKVETAVSYTFSTSRVEEL